MYSDDTLIKGLSVGLLVSGATNAVLGLYCMAYGNLVGQLKANQHPILRLETVVPAVSRRKFDPDLFDKCLYQEKGYHDWVSDDHYHGKDNQSQQVSIWYEGLKDFPEDMRVAAREKLGYK